MYRKACTWFSTWWHTYLPEAICIKDCRLHAKWDQGTFDLHLSALQNLDTFPKTMRFSSLAIVALIGGASAAPNPLKHGEQEALADKAMTNLGEHIAANGYANPKCTLKNAAVRKEW